MDQSKSPQEIKEAILKQLNSPIIEALNSEGITPSKLAKLLNKELNAKQVKVFAHKGEVIYSDPLDALDIQQKARMDAHKLLDHYPAERHKIEPLAPITIIFDAPDAKEERMDIDE